MSEILEVREVVKTFDSVRAVDGVSFTVRRGTITGLLGGWRRQTTTIRMITGIFMPDSGSIAWRSASASGAAFRDDIGYLPEERGLYKQMKLVEQLLFLAEIKGKKASQVVGDRSLAGAIRADRQARREARGVVEGQPAEGAAHRHSAP